MSLTRRTFLRRSAYAGAGLAIGIRVPAAAPRSRSSFEPSAYIRITPDNVVTLWVTRSEMGQGVRTNLPAALTDRRLTQGQVAELKLRPNSARKLKYVP